MPTSRQSSSSSTSTPRRAKLQRGSIPLTEWEKEREWIPLWLAGPVVALMLIFGLIGCAIGLAELYAWIVR